MHPHGTPVEFITNQITCGQNVTIHQHKLADTSSGKLHSHLGTYRPAANNRNFGRPKVDVCGIKTNAIKLSKHQIVVDEFLRSSLAQYHQRLNALPVEDNYFGLARRLTQLSRQLSQPKLFQQCCKVFECPTFDRLPIRQADYLCLQ
ncbi:hypothetical protein ARC63_05510 [Stenotrophomonas geniculata ATCC 19374 = JCM 13324]|nr:hypothetical protein ARC63_05510 [Stenotrophomonas geniculata ATCC 19374 = JCM 13324]